MQQTLILIVGSTSGAVATFLLQKYGFSAVLAASLVGLIGSLIGHLLNFPQLPFVILMGSFVGMTNTLMSSFPFVILAGISSGLLYSISHSFFAGFGGRLGVIAFICTVLCFYLITFLKKG
jgi:uncharacterized membrane protein YeaQ/YmgE (transglycosylase-associated protein family)